ncbi:MAG: ABC transporter ATP-binding protein [Nitrospira sp.]|nr:ABC transporter ATP-binding protein [Nitrospira sp.]
MGDIAIRVEGIGKEYRIGKKERYKTLRDTLTSTFAGPFQKAGKLLRGEGLDAAEKGEMIWALKDISFKVRRGEAIGVIGGNGAGKSTFLKILSRITEPTTGFADIYGRVGSLLEVGTGFHPELTGRENIYLNGAILGMKRGEIDRKFDEIVAFSEVERFIDTPVKHYSSGMYLRLAFAVAAHLEPEILLVDEVLAVGDAGFQKKCLGKMGTVAKEGRTVLLVSHNMGAITQLCGTTVHLEKGRLKRVGPSAEVVSAYLSSSVGADVKSSWSNDASKPNHAEVRLSSARLLSIDEQPVSVVHFNNAFLVEIAYSVTVPIRDLSISYKVYDGQGNLVFESMDTDMPEWKGRVREPGQYRSLCEILPSFLKPGRYYVSLTSFVEKVKIIERQESVLSFDVSEVGYPLNPGRLGIVSPVFQWKVTV